MKYLKIIACFLVLVVQYSWSQTTAIPDTSFEEYLETHNSAGDEVEVGDAESMGDGILGNALVETSRISSVLFLDVSGLGILDLTGIEAFTNLETLICSSNNLEELNISNNLNLKSLLCGSNDLSQLNVLNNSNLESLNASDNKLENLDLSNNSLLETISISKNQISTIDLSDNSELNLLSISDNRLVGILDVSNNINLESLFCASNQISEVDLSTNTVLKQIDLSNNILTSLDLSQVNTVVCPSPQTDPVTTCQGPGSINVSRNQLTSLIINNGYNELFTSLNATDNPDLFCIHIDSGFEAPINWQKDDWAYYTDGICVDIFTYVPDDNFEQALIDAGLDNTLDNLVLTENINILTTLDVSNKSISDLTGIADFSALEILDARLNLIETIDLSANTNLIELDVSNNDLSDLNLSQNANLTTVYCESNALEDLNLTNLGLLQILNCSNNLLTSFDVDANSQLNDLDCSFNQIESLNVSANTALVSLECNDNNLFALNLTNGNNNSITSFSSINNPNLFCIEVDNVANANSATGWQKDANANYNLDCGTYVPDDNFEQALIDQGIDSDNTLNNYVPTADVVNYNAPLDVSGLNISDLTGIEGFTNLQTLNCSNNNLSVLELSSNTALTNLHCSFNRLENLNLINNSAIAFLLCNNNALQTLNVENGNNNVLATFEVTNNPNLFCINVDDAIVGNIPAAWQKDDFAAYSEDCENSRITLIPDTLFEQALIDLGLDTIIDGQVLTADIEHIHTLDVSNESISDLTGIRDFKSLIQLDCSGNFLDELDVSDMLFLERLNCGSNFLLTNDINNPNGIFNTTNTPSLKELFCANNNLNDLDTSANLNLELLDCADNNLSSLVISDNTILKDLNCSNNELTTLDISGNTSLETVDCNSNALETLTTSSIANTSLTSLSCSNNMLTDLLLNNYQGLSRLNCSSNQLTSLNLSSNTDLVFLSMSINQISDIDISNNTLLEEALISQNELVNLDVSANVNLTNLNCEFNEILVLDLSANGAIERLYCANNQLNSLDLSGNPNLIQADFSSNTITNVVLSNDLSALKALNAANNQIEGDLDLTTFAIAACEFQSNQDAFCPENISLNVSNNLLDFINIQNGINGVIANFNASGNPNLECIQVDDANTVPANWQKDGATTYSLDCNFGETFVPDDNFEQTLIDLGLDVPPLNDFVLTTNIQNLTDIDLSNRAINDLTGIEDFLNLESLNVSNNNLSELDLSSNTGLLSLNCSNNQLTELQVQDNILITDLNCSANAISELELSSNTSLSNLNIDNNSISNFQPSTVLALEFFSCENNAIEVLDFQQNQFLNSINCAFNLLETLNIRNGQNDILTSLDAQNNPDLICIETDTGVIPNGAVWLFDATAQITTECFFGQTFVPDDNFEQALIDLGYDGGVLDDYVSTDQIEGVSFLNISGLEISNLTGIEDFISLSSLNFENNNITTVDLSQNILLASLDASNNNISQFDLSGLINLTVLDLSNNELTQLDFTENTELTDLNVAGNLLTAIEVDMLANLEELSCASNQLTSLNVTQNSNLRVLLCQSNQFIADQVNVQNENNESLELFNVINNPDLRCILVDNPVAVILNENGLYDNWLKDDSAGYQSVCEDADNDGIPNVDDLCPNTEFGATVDLFGCAIPNLPVDNFTISVTSENLSQQQ
jgi:Leucine-rich repeat (LRR) protein